MKTTTNLALVLLSLSGLSACEKPEQALTAMGDAESISFNWDVRPVLSDNCFACHGPDAEGGQKAGLRLDSFDTATAELPESPGKFAIIPGSPESSEIIRRITSSDPDVVMPPPSTNKSVSTDEAAMLSKWIEGGAEYQAHWAYVAPIKTALPNSEAELLAVNEIDNYIFARLLESALKPAKEADRATLINRVSLDLTGLPPSLEAVDNFVSDSREDAYEQLVDELLESTAYAEHMTAQWMDIARYADTDGYLGDDGARLLYPWRDWVISAFEENLPFDEFSTWQIAGDLLENPSYEQLLATTFLRLGQRSTENGLIEEEYLAEYAIDRLETVGVGYLGHTVGCARCHDHKYDPISIKDFYAFSAFFSNTMEPGFYAPGGEAPYGSNTEVGPTLIVTDQTTNDELASLKEVVAKHQSDYETVHNEIAKNALNSASNLLQKSKSAITERIAKSIEAATVAYYPLDSAYQGSLDFAKVVPVGIPNAEPALPVGLQEEHLVLTASNFEEQEPGVLQAPIFGEGVLGNAFYFDSKNKGYLGAGVGAYDRTDAFSFDFWLKPADVYEDATILNYMHHARFASIGYNLNFVNNTLRFDMIHTRPNNMLSVKSLKAVPVGKWSQLTVTYDGSSTAKGLSLYLNGEPLELEITADRLSKSSLPVRRGWLDDAMYGLAFGKRWQQFSLPDSGLDEIKVFDRELSAVEVSYLHNGDAVSIDENTLAAYITATDEKVVAAKDQLRTSSVELNQLVSALPEIMIMGDDPKGRPAYVLQRGVYSDPGEEVYPQGFDQIYEWDENLPRNRLGLSQWLFNPGNPLTSRVTINRMWQSLFGRGLVESAEDFGTQGSIPSHPELLDWLAVEFVESGWDLRHMQKLMVMSATYRQDSRVTEAAKAVDPYNLLLSRGVRQRFSAEIIRDNALLTSGLLESEVGGASVYPYQPGGVWEAVSVNDPARYPHQDAIDESQHHRRSMYGYVKRAAQHPAMQVFDMPTRISTIARRRISNTPLQALVLLNDPQYMETYEGIAARAMAAELEQDKQVRHIYKLALRREPSAAELDVLLGQYDRALTRFSSDSMKAVEYLKVGVSDFDINEDDLAEFATLASVARIVMNSPDVYNKR